MRAKGFSLAWGCFSEKAAHVLRSCALGTLLLCAAGAALAQPQSRRSALANIDLPAGARDWVGDEDGSKQATLDFAASLAGVACAAREARAWPASSSAAADDVATRTNTALLGAGWVLEPLSRTPDGQRILHARRGTDRLVVVWQPAEGEVGLLLCRVEGATADAPADAASALPTNEDTAPAPAATDLPATPPQNTAPRSSRIDDAFGPPTPPPVAAAPPEQTAPEPPRSDSAPVPAAPPVAEAPAGPPANVEPVPPPAIVDAAPQAAPARDDSLPALLVAVLALAGGGIALIVREMQARRLDTAWQWPTATTTIERGWIEDEEARDRRGVPVTAYLPVLKYRYAVDGEEYEGSQIGLDDAPMATAEAARRRLAKYPDFTTVEIRYDPEDPGFAVIEAPRPKPGLDFYFGVGAIVIALGMLLSHFF
jgi:hypothetical protein